MKKFLSGHLMTDLKKSKILIRVFLAVMTLFVGGISYAARSEYIYDDYGHYPASGWMAMFDEISLLSLDTAYPYGAAEGSLCIRMSVAGWWAGFFFQAKGAWRTDITETPKGLDLSGYTAVKVQAKADAAVAGANIVQFGIGETGDSCGNIRTDWLSLTTEWQTFTIDLPATTDLTDVNGLFMVAMEHLQSVNTVIYIDDIRFVGPGPAAIKDLAPNFGPQPGTVALSWTAPAGDYAHTGYIVRYSSSDYIRTQSDFDHAVNYNQSWVPAAANTPEQKIITGFTPGQSYYIAIETADTEGNRSPLSNICYALARTAGIGVEVQGTVDLGILTTEETKTGSDPIIVTNTGGVPITLHLSLVDPPGWTAASLSGLDRYILLGAFGSNSGAVAWDVNKHILSATEVTCTDQIYAGDQNGVNMAMDASRKLWLRLTAPLAISQGTQEQTIIIKVTGSTP